MNSQVINPKATPRRRRFRYSLRSFMLVFIAVCVWLGWIIPAARKQERGVATILGLGGQVMYDYEGYDLPPDSHLEPSWIAKRLGVDFFYNVVLIRLDGDDSKGWNAQLPQVSRLFPRLRSVIFDDGADVRDEDLQHLSGLTELESLSLKNDDINGIGFKFLAKLKKLNSISLRGTPITDRGLEAIATLPTVAFIGLSKTNITDAGVEQLKSAVSLRYVNFNETRLTDACIDLLASFPSLRCVEISGTLITADGVLRLQRLRPLLNIVCSQEQTPPSLSYTPRGLRPTHPGDNIQ
jgi:hypothetical protein